MKKRIVQHCFGAPSTGGPVVAFERFLERSTKEYGQIRQELPAGGINITLLRRFVTELKLMQPELIHIRGLGNEGFHASLAARLAGVPNILVSIHGTQRDLQNSASLVRSWIVTNVLERLTLQWATHIATVCEFTANRSFLVPYRNKVVGVVPNGTDVLQGPKDGRELRAKLGISQQSPVAICVSRITVEKGYSVLADALSGLDEEISNLTLLVVGGGDESGSIRSMFSALKNIKVFFVGQQKNVQRYLSAADFFLFPSLHENLSNALIEAMGSGLPVIATAVGGNVEVVKKGGGLLVPPGDSSALAAAITRMLIDKKLVRQLGCAAESNVRLNYSVEKMVSGWERIYSNILGEVNEEK